MNDLREFMAELGSFIQERLSLSPVPTPDPTLPVPSLTAEGFLLARGVTIWNVYEQVNVQVQAYFRDDWVWVNDLVLENDEEIFAVVGYEGRLYRTPVSVQDGIASIGELEAVEVQYTPVTTRSVSPILITREANGRRRWLRQLSTAVLLRSGGTLEIDSRELYDSFIAAIERTGQYPIASLCHMGENFRVGQATYIWRDGFCLFESGLFDESELANRVADDIEANGSYWGTSIEFVPTALPSREEIAGGVPLYVHREGIMTSGDFLPEAQAASLFTGDISIKRGVMQQYQRDALARLGYTEAQIEEAAARARSTNSSIQENGLIARSQDQGQDPPAPAPETPATPAGDPPAPATQIVLDAAALTYLREQIGGVTTEQFVALQQGFESMKQVLADIVVREQAAAVQRRDAPASIQILAPGNGNGNPPPAAQNRGTQVPASQKPAPTNGYQRSAFAETLAPAIERRP